MSVSVKKQRYLLAFHKFGFGESFIDFLMRRRNDDEVEYLWEKADVGQILKINPKLYGEKIDNWGKRDRFLHEKVIDDLGKACVKYLFFGDGNYSFLLSKIPDPPPILYYKGEVSNFNNPVNLAVVGARKMTNYGKNCLDKLLPQVINRGVCIVSGLALGVDSYAHEIALNCKGRTVGVIGNGLDTIYPRDHRWLYEKVLDECGLIVSAFPLGFGPLSHHFPIRNRIISGLSNSLLIVEAAARSGTLTTADQALKQGRDVMVIPGDIDRELSVGTNRLWKEGAAPVFESRGILEVLGLGGLELSSIRIGSNLERNILKVLTEPKEFDRVLQEIDIDHIKLQVILSNMEIKGYIKSDGSLWRKNG